MSEPCFCDLEEAWWGKSLALLLLKICFPAAFKDFGSSTIPAGEPGLGVLNASPWNDRDVVPLVEEYLQASGWTSSHFMGLCARFNPEGVTLGKLK